MKESLLDNIVEIPNSELQEPEDKDNTQPVVKEVCIPCSICQRHVPELIFFSHKQQHGAFALMGYKSGEKPANIESLNSQKSQVISGRTKSSPYIQKERQKINRSHEIIRRTLFSKVEYANPVTIQDLESVQVYRKEKNNILIKSIVICSDKNASWQEDMEDTFTVLDNYGRRENTTFVGLFDGCNGTVAARAVSTDLPLLFLSQLAAANPSYTLTDEESNFISSFDTVFKESYKEREEAFSTSIQSTSKKDSDFQMVHASYAKAFCRMDRILKLGRGESSLSRWSGCAALTCLIDGHPSHNETKEKDDMNNISNDTTNSIKPRLGMLHVANLGNIKAVLCRNGKSYRLTKEHSTSSYRERIRVMETGGCLSSNEEHGLIEGFCRLTRGLGFHGDAKLKNSVIPAPCTISIPIYESCQFLLLATSGLWGVLNETEAVAVILESFASFLQRTTNIKHLEQNGESGEKRSRYVGSSVKALVSEDFEDVDGETETLNAPPCHESSDCTDSEIHDLEELHNVAAAHACKQLVKTAIHTGSQQNVTVCLILLPGCNDMYEL